MPQPPIRVAFVEDHPPAVRALTTILQSTPGVTLCATARDVDEGLALLDDSCPDLILVDLGLPGDSGYHIIHQVRRRWRGTCTCAVLTLSGNEADLRDAICAGATGYLFKSDPPATWHEPLGILAAGGGVLRDGVARHLRDSQGAHPDPSTQAIVEWVAAGHYYNEIGQRMALTTQQVAEKVRHYYLWMQDQVVRLSDREWEFLDLRNQGYSGKESAQTMGIEECTSKTLAQRAYEKLGASNLQEALYAARRKHLLR